jgi:hypothetical protein
MSTPIGALYSAIHARASPSAAGRWAVAFTTKRKNSIKKHIRTQLPRGPDIFVVILPDELEALITDGAEEYLKNSNPKGAS